MTYCLATVFDPLPKLDSSDLGRRSVLLLLAMRSVSMGVPEIVRLERTIRKLIGTHPFPEIQAAQYDSALQGQEIPSQSQGL